MQNVQQKNPYINFGAAKDINLKYIMRNRSYLLPARVQDAVSDILERGGGLPLKELPTLKEVHERTYAPLMQAGSLEEVRVLFSEFRDVRDFTEIAKKFARSARVIATRMNLEDFSLDCLKKIWSGMPQEEIVKSYGFSCRDVLSKICKTLHIPKPEGNYLVLLKNSDEEGNRRVADMTRRHLDVCCRNLELANKANRTPEARAKHAESMRRFYEEHPERRELLSLISQTTWNKCPHIKQAMAVYTKFQPPRVLEAIDKQKAGIKLSEDDVRLVQDFYRRFWANFPNLRDDFSQARMEAFKELTMK